MTAYRRFTPTARQVRAMRDHVERTQADYVAEQVQICADAATAVRSSDKLGFLRAEGEATP